MAKRNDTSAQLSRCPPNRMRDEINQGNGSSISIVLQGVMHSVESVDDVREREKMSTWIWVMLWSVVHESRI